MSDPRCKCTMSISMTGDGCRYCQPQEHIERMGEWLNGERDEITALHTENKELQALVSGLVEALQSVLEFGNDTNTNRGAWAVGKAHKVLAAYRKGERS